MLMRRICASVGISIFILFISLCLAISVSAEPKSNNFQTDNLTKQQLSIAPGRVLVKFAESVAEDEAEEIVRGVGARTKRRAYKNAFRVLTAPRGQEMKMVAALTKNSRVLYAEPDYLAHADFLPNDEYYRPYQWNLDTPFPETAGIQMEEAWDITGGLDPAMRGGDPDVVVAVLDTGIAYENYNGYCQAPDFANTHFVQGYDFVHGDSHANDDNSHGTHVAGTIAQSTDNGLGVAGIAFNVTLMPVKVLDAAGQGYYSQIADGIRWAADNEADVINMSLSGRWPNSTLLYAVQYAYDKGVVIVASSGNESRNRPGYPARYDQVIAVGATTYDNKLAYYSNKGNELCAPGGVDNEDLNGDGRTDRILQQTFDPDTKDVCVFWYHFFFGTSMAAPHVSGLAALILSVDPSLTNVEIRDVLRDNADDIGVGACGNGFINAYRALDAVADVDNPPYVTITYPASGVPVSGPVTITADATDVGGGVTKVEFFIDDDDEPVFVDTNGSDGWSYTWITENESDSAHTISVTAWDTGLQWTTDTIRVYVCNPPECVDGPPSVTITNPENGATISGPVNITADAYDDFGVTKVEFSIDGESIGQDTNGSDGWSVGWNTENATDGTHTISATAWDNANPPATATATINVTVDNPEIIYIHVGDLDGLSFTVFWSFWGTRITITVHDSNEEPVANAFVSGVFSDGPTVFTCATGGEGTCWVEGYQWTLNCLTFTVTDVQYPDLEYMASFNHDPDGDSDGTAITTCRP